MCYYADFVEGDCVKILVLLKQKILNLLILAKKINRYCRHPEACIHGA